MNTHTDHVGFEEADRMEQLDLEFSSPPPSRRRRQPPDSYERSFGQDDRIGQVLGPFVACGRSYLLDIRVDRFTRRILSYRLKPAPAA